MSLENPKVPNFEIEFSIIPELNVLDLGTSLKPIAEKYGMPLSKILTEYGQYVLRRAQEQAHAEQE